MKRQALLTLALVGLLGSAALQAQKGDFKKGVSYYKQGQFARAIEEFEPIVAEQPEYEAGFRVLGDCYLKLKQWGKAAAAFKRAAELKGDNYVSHYGLAVASFNQDKFRDSAAALLRAEKLASGPRRRYQLLSLRGSAYYNLGDYRRAAADLEQAVQIQRGQFNDVLQLGVSYYELGRQAEAERYLTQALALESSSEEARSFLGNLHYQQALGAIDARQYPQAVQKLEAFLANNAEDSDAWFNLGLAYLFSEDLAKAEAAFTKSAALNESRWETWDRLGYLYEKQGRYQKSLDSYTKALGLKGSEELQASVDRVKERIRRAKG